MIETADALSQPERLAALAASDLLDTGALPALDRVVKIAARLLDAPVAQLNVVTADQQIPISHVGGKAWGRPVDLDRSFCQHVIRTGEPLVVADARTHPDVATSTATQESGIVAYLSVPIISPRAIEPLATLCVVDFRTREWGPIHIADLTDLAALALSEIELRAVNLRERRRAMDTLRASEKRLRAIYDSTYEYIGLLSPDGTVLDCNRASLEFVGNTRDDVIGEYFWETPWFRFTPGAPELLRVAVGRAAEGEFVRYEATLRRPGADPITFDFSLHPVCNDDGEVVFIVPEGRDITERKRTEAKLELERARLLEVIRRAPAFVAVLRGNTHVLEIVNDAFMQLVGHRSVIGRPLFDAMPEVRGQGIEALLEEVGATGEPFVGRGLRIALRHEPDGPVEQRTLDLSFVPLTEIDGARSGIVLLGTDVTDQVDGRNEAERARDRAERLQALTAALADCRTIDDIADVVVADMVVALGAKTGSLSRTTTDGTAMAVIRTVGFPDDPAVAGMRRQPLGMRSPLTECFRTRAPVWIESRDGPDGLDRRYPPVAAVWDVLGVQSAAFVPLVTAGETVGVIGFAFETARTFPDDERAFLLTLGKQAALAVERARLFDAERAARAEAEAANRAKAEFLAVMSHELRTPLNAIGGYVELMAMGIRGPVSPQQRADLQRVQISQRHLMGLINEVLNFAKLETGAVRFDIDDVPVRDAISAAETLLAPQADAKGLTLVIGLCPPELVVRADAEKLRQILVNLIANAVKFTDRGGRITVDYVVADHHVDIIVDDSGIGIAADQLHRIFEPFVQVRADLTRTAEGTGLGLAISRDLARGMKGDLTAESTPGVGSIFRLRLPTA